MAKDYSKYTNEELIKYIGELQKQLASTKYGLYWDKNIEEEDAFQLMKTNIPFLDRKEFLNKQSDLSTILIQGDNLHSASLLNMALPYGKKIDVVYIDPPYNTGHGDSVFTYNDKSVNKDDGYYHSKWLNQISRRLSLLRDLMDDKGVIFISIDDNELYNLKLLCDSIFGENNFLGNIVQNKGNAQNDALDLQKNHEYCLVYCKKRFYVKKNNKVKEIPHLYETKVETKELIEENGRYYYIGSGITTGGEGGTLKARLNLGYTIYYNPKTHDFIGIEDYDKEIAKISDEESEVYTDNKEYIENGYIPIRPPKKKGKLGVWTWELKKFNSEKDTILIKKTSKGYSINKKMFVEASDIKVIDGKHCYFKETKAPLKSILDFSSAAGSSELINVLTKQEFNNPKNVEFIKYLIKSFPKKDALVLDIYAGSGTTAQSVLELNEEDGGSRQVILCTNNEKNICTNVTYPRTKTVVTGIRPNGTKYCEPRKVNFLYYIVDFMPDSNSRDQAKYNLAEKVDELLCINEGLYNEVERTAFCSHYSNAISSRHLFIYSELFNKEKFASFVNLIKSYSGDKAVYVYSNNYELDDEILSQIPSDAVVKPIPSKIYEIYKTIVEEFKRG